ncbi:MAG: DUF3429 domain-containing protein [Burkholderiales bacterium]|nr:DUF3429 domain-containing protein [Burkholderiales bacterium]
MRQAQIKILGYGGLIPFFGCVALAYGSEQSDFWIYSLHIYGVIIASFLGAISWGLAISSKSMLPVQRDFLVYWGVMPAILGWICMLIPQSVRLIPLLILFLLTLAVDIYICKKHTLPKFWLELRVCLTSGVILALLLAAFSTQR